MGLINMQGQQTQGPPFADPNAPASPPQQMGNPAEQQGDDQSNVSPEEQQQYDTVMHKAADIIYGKGKVMKPILDSLSAAKGAPPADASGAAPADQEQGEAPDSEQGPGEGAQDKGNPAVLALANTAVQIVSKLDASAKEAGQPISDDVLYHAGSEIVGMLAEVAEAANIHSYSDDEIQGAFYQALDQYRPIAEEMGRTDDATLKSQFGQILDADAQGQLGQVLPGIDQPGQPTQ